MKRENIKILKELFEVTKKALTINEHSGICDSYGICLMCALKYDLDEVINYNEEEELKKETL